MSRPRILVTNDDGVFSEGIERLASALAGVGDVFTVAPDQERSAAGHSLTLHHPLRAKLIGPQRWSVDGTPTDCVNWGVLHLLRDNRPKLLFSGINLGLNLGDDVTYSGTVSAAFEGTLIGIPSVAVSQEIETGFTFDAAADFAARLARHLLDQPLPPGTLVNVNVPAGAPRGLKVVRLGRRRYGEAVIEKKDPRGRPYYWIGATPPKGDIEQGTDLSAVAEKYISMTPLHLDMTHYGSLELLEGLAGRLALTPSLSQREREKTGETLSQREREKTGETLSQREREKTGETLSQEEREKTADLAPSRSKEPNR